MIQLHIDTRDDQAGERDRVADERDNQADQRDVEADERDHAAEAAERHPAGGVLIDLRERHKLCQLREQAGAERQQAASDRAIAADDREQAGLDRQMAAQDRDDALEEHEVSQRDQLTGVLQRGAGLIALQGEAARSSRSGASFSVGFIDVDGLKHINDEHGHGAGDEVLRLLGETLRLGLRSYDVALRYGGDEFVCILPGSGIEDSERRLRVLQAQLAAGSTPVAMTFGVAAWKPGEATEALLARADAALYATRRGTRGDNGGPPSSDDGSAAVSAHRLLNSSAIVTMGISTLQENGDDLTGPIREHLLDRMLVHSTLVDDRLKAMTQGRP
jgi:diguanylate cyclase (GGDEF)-like protein